MAVLINRRGEGSTCRPLSLRLWALQLALMWLALHLGGGIKQIAAAMVICYITYSALSLFLSGLNLEGSWRQGIILWLKVCLPVVYIISWVVIISSWHYWSIRNIYLVTTMRFGTLGSVSLPVIVYLVWMVSRARTQVKLSMKFI